jgi:glycosyltransferase involved in cell wall biosynthesis
MPLEPATDAAHRLLVVIPVYDHEHAIAKVVAGVQQAAVPCLLVDDGSRASCALVLQQLSQQPQVGLLRLELAGFAHAAALGYSHVLQIDADGQHDTADIPAFIAASQQQPDAVICGIPAYDQSVPKARLYGRYATHIWVWINTLSLHLRDSMCGFRVYPLAPLQQLVASARLGRRMDFDTEVLVRLYWRQVPVAHRLTRVTYPVDGVSHFDVWRDNLRISAMHARLFLGMLRRLPRLLRQRLSGRPG